MSNLASLVVSLEANILKFEADLATAEGRAKAFASNLEGMADKAMTSIKGLAAGFAAAYTFDAFRGGIEGAIKAADELKNLSEKSGVTVEALSKIKGVAALSGTSIDEVATGLQKMSLKMYESATGSAPQTAEAFKRMGVAITDSRGNLRDAGEVFIDVSKKLGDMKDGAEKVALAKITMGKQAMNLLPVINDLNGAGELQAKITRQMADEADAYEKNLVRLDARKKAFYTTIASQFLPVMRDVTDAFLSAGGGADSLNKNVNTLATNGTLTQWARGAALTAAMVFDTFTSLLDAIKSVGAGLGALGASAVAVAQGNFGLVRGIFSAFKDDLAHMQGTSMAFKLQQEFDKRDAGLKQVAVNSPAEDSKPHPTGKLSAKVSEYERLMQAVSQHAAQLNLEASGEEKLTAMQRYSLSVLEELRSGKLKLTVPQSQSLALQLESLLATEREISAHAASKKAIDDTIAAHEREREALTKRLASEADRVAKIGLTTEQLGHLRQAEIEADIAEKERILTIERSKGINTAALEDEIRLMRQLQGLEAQGAKKQADFEALKKTQEEMTKLTDNLQRSLTDAIMRGFENGKGIAQNFRDTLYNMFKTLVLQPAIQAAMQPVAQGMQQALGGGIAGLIGGLFNANGNAFGGGGVQAFANGAAFTNSIVDSATPFRFANGGGFSLGVMGEAGPEAVMPLTRDVQGRLGVRVSGDGGNGGGNGMGNMHLTNNFSFNGAPPDSRTQSQIALSVWQAAQAAMNRNG